MRVKRRAACDILAYVLLFGLIVGCSTPRSTSPVGSMPILKNRFVDFRTAGKEVEEAERMIKAGDYTVVTPRLQHVISKYPESQAGIDARYWLAVAYQKMNSAREAIDMFSEYLRLAPEGKYASEAKACVAQLQAEYQSKYPSPEELDKQIQSISEQAIAHPENLELRLELADLLWKRGNYEEAGRIYYSITKEHPELAADSRIVSRVELLPNGTYVVLSPAEVQRREIQEKPLVVVNTASFRSGRDLFTRERKYYVVTGQAYNRSDSVLYGVQVIVTLYGFGGMVYDSTAYNIGRLNPGERRAFSVRFSNFDTLDNILRYECEGVFER